MLCAVFGCGWKIGDTALHTTVYACHKANKQTKRESKKQSCCNIVLSLYYLKKLGVREGFSEVIFPHIKHITIAIIGLEHQNIVSHTFKHVVFKASNLSTAVYCFTFIWQKILKIPMIIRKMSAGLTNLFSYRFSELIVHKK